MLLGLVDGTLLGAWLREALGTGLETADRLGTLLGSSGGLPLGDVDGSVERKRRLR